MGWIAFAIAYIPLMFGVYNLAKRYGRGAVGWTFGSLSLHPITCIITLLCFGETKEKHNERIVADELLKID
jgi:Na+/melibiose symporter-like transporter